MSFPALIARRARVLTEGSVYELLRRNPTVAFDPFVAHAGLICDPRSRAILREVHRRYFEIASARSLPLLAFTDTWRASAARTASSQFHGRDLNRDNVAFLRELADECGGNVFVAGMSGPHGDAYKPDEAPSRAEAVRIHRPQIEALARAGVDVVFAATLPSLDEALGIAEVMAESGTPWMLSFVVRPTGNLLDGTPLRDAIGALDDLASPALGFSINCVHPSIAAKALATLDDSAAARIVAFQGNTSALSPEELDGQSAIHTEDPSRFAEAMALVARNVPIVGGCCGTDTTHMEAVGDLLQSLAS